MGYILWRFEVATITEYHTHDNETIIMENEHPCYLRASSYFAPCLFE
jgi:hypothetical protein